MLKWDCPHCDLQVRISEPTGAEADRLLQILRDLHMPHCPGGLADSQEVGPA